MEFKRSHVYTYVNDYRYAMLQEFRLWLAFFDFLLDLARSFFHFLIK